MQQLQDHCKQRQEAAKQITDPNQRETFVKLLKINEWLIKMAMNISDVDDVAKVWFTELSDTSNNIAFLPKVDQECKTPELNELTSFVHEMQVQWMEEYYPMFDAANESRGKFGSLPDQKSN